MSTVDERQAVLAAKFEAIVPHLDERQRRLLFGAEARSIGHGGIRLVARAAGVREATVSLGVSDLDSGPAPLGRVRRPGGGRKRVVDVDPGLRAALLALVEPDTGPPPKLTPADRVLATVLYLRRSFPQPLLAQLFGVHRSQITRAIAETQKLLGHHDHTAIASTARFHTPTDIVSFIANVEATKIKPAS
jgi:hypothetical protein